MANLKQMLIEQAMRAGQLSPESTRISQRLPTATTATEDPYLQNLLINQTVLDQSGTLGKNMEVFKGPDYNFRLGRGKKPETVAKNVKGQIVDNLLYLYDMTPDAMHGQAKLWYDGANKLSGQFSDAYGHSKDAVSGVMAALSPQMDWYKNVTLAERTLDAFARRHDGLPPEAKDWMQKYFFRQAKDEKDAAKIAKDLPDAEAVLNLPWEELSNKQKAIWIRAYDEGTNPRGYRIVTPDGQFGDHVLTKKGEEAKAGWGSFTDIGKAVSVLENPSIENISGQMGNAHKVRNFFNNIRNPNDPHGDVTIDTHAVAAGHMEPFSGASKPVMVNLGAGPSSSVTGAQGSYGLYADAYRDAAKQVGVLPREMQSISWEGVRGLYSPQFKSQKKNTDQIAKVMADYKAGKLSLEQAQKIATDIGGGIELPSWYKEGRDVRNVKSTATSSYKKGLAGILATATSGSALADDAQDAMSDTGLDQLREGQAKAGLKDYMQRPMSKMGDVNPTREHAAKGEIDRSSRMRQMYIDKLGPDRGSEAFNAVQQVIEQVKRDAYLELQQKLYDTGSHPNQLNSHRAPASETMVDLGEALQSKYGMGMLDITGKAIERIGQGEKLGPMELGLAGLESATLPFTAGSAGYLKNAAKVGGFAGTGAGVDVGLTTGLSANTLRSILKRMQEEEATRGR